MPSEQIAHKGSTQRTPLAERENIPAVKAPHVSVELTPQSRSNILRPVEFFVYAARPPYKSLCMSSYYSNNNILERAR